jgi:hypothetical protein
LLSKHLYFYFHLSTGTNIHDAVLEALKMFDTKKTEGVVNMIVFMTDGQATSGVTDKDTMMGDINVGCLFN